MPNTTKLIINTLLKKLIQNLTDMKNDKHLAIGNSYDEDADMIFTRFQDIEIILNALNQKPYHTLANQIENIRAFFNDPLSDDKTNCLHVIKLLKHVIL